ncbi:MAG TPA: TonB-dependent receptor, partial [Pyrinomonadaceae bacterium]|nr:TonB-dependent receptor [Pyrinomonadaceae bacterium]
MKFLQAFIFILVISIGVFAQATGTLTGQVVDSVGAIIPNATVTVTNGSGVERTATANNSGQFTITGLPSGTYTVRVGATDFAPYENTEVVVAAGQRAELIVTLTIAEVQAEVEISSEGQVNTDAENNKSALVLKGEDLESLPEDPDELAAALQALAGPSAGPNGGQFFIDGFSGGRLPPRESIREIRINQNPFSSEYDRLGFGRVEILTKPGSSKFRGQAFFNFNDEILNSRNPFAANRAQTQTRFYGGNISGPIIKNKASYFFDIDNRQIDDNAVVNATILDANLNPTLFSEAFVVPIRRFSISPRFDYALNEQNTLVVRYGFTRNKADNRGLGGFSLPSRAFETSNTQHNFQLTETAILSPTIVNETRFQYNRERNQQNGNSSIPTINVADAFTGGGSNIGLNFNNEDRFELQNYTTTGFGKHSLKFGARLRSVFQKDRSESNFGGTFTFTSLEQYRQTILGNLRPTQFIITSGDPLVDVSQTDFSLFANDDWRVRPDLTLSLGLRYEIQNNINDRFNFAPRFGFAYSPGAGGAKQPKTVFGGGFGI